MKKLLIIGASSYLGKYLFEESSKYFETIGTCHSNCREGLLPLNITKKEEVSRLLRKADPEIIAILSALTNVERCESNPELAREINVKGVENIMENCENRKVVLFSTDAVFSGKKEEYFEGDRPEPYTIYGKTKAEAERIVNSGNNLIIRTARLYGADDSPKFINLVIRKLKNGDEIKAPKDTPGNPTLAEDLSRTVIDLIRRDKSGIYHAAGPPVDSLYSTALSVSEILGLDKSKVVPVEKNWNSKIERMAVVLNTEKVRKENEKLRSLEDGLRYIRSRS